MYFAKMVGRSVDVLFWDNEDQSAVEQHLEVRIGRPSLYVVMARYKRPIPADQCNALVDFKGMLQSGLQVTLLRRWYFGVTIERVSVLRADLEWAAEELADSPAG
jgi:hypothetical protein